VAEHAVDGVKVLFALIMQLLGLRLQLLEASLGIDVDGVLGMLAYVELGPELLWCLRSWHARETRVSV